MICDDSLDFAMQCGLHECDDVVIEEPVHAEQPSHRKAFFESRMDIDWPPRYVESYGVNPNVGSSTDALSLLIVALLDVDAKVASNVRVEHAAARSRINYGFEPFGSWGIRKWKSQMDI